MHPGEMLGNRLGLVRLNGADKVPDQGQLTEFGLFFQGFLQVVFAEVTQARGIGFAHRGSRFGLAHRKQANAV